MTRTTVAMIGLGAMGSGMARSLLRAGHRVIAADRDPSRVLDAVNEGAVTEIDPPPAILVNAVLNAEQVEATLFGQDGWAARMTPGGVVVVCATIPPEAAREFAKRCADLGLQYLDAPISGGAAKAADGTLSIMASGAPAAFAAASPALDAMAATVHPLGDAAGTGSAMKAVNQLLAGSHIAVMAEALTFAASQGLDLALTVEVIGASAGASWMFANRAPHVVESDYTPRSAVTIWPKDLGIVTAIAQEAGVPVPMAETALQQFSEAVAAGLGDEDDAALTKLHAAAAAVSLGGPD